MGTGSTNSHWVILVGAVACTLQADAQENTGDAESATVDTDNTNSTKLEVSLLSKTGKLDLPGNAFTRSSLEVILPPRGILTTALA